MRPWTVLSGLLGLVAVASSSSFHDSAIELRSSAEAACQPDCDSQNALVFRTEPELTEARKLRILCLGDSITVGYLSDSDGGDGNGYRLDLRDRLEEDGNDVVFAGTERYPGSTMTDAYFAAWSGKTIKYIDDNMQPSLAQRPNLVLLHAGTNDMNPNRAISREGNDPAQAALRLGVLIDHIIEACPDAVIMVAVIIGTCDPQQAPATQMFQALIPEVVEERLAAGHHVLTADFSGFPASDLRDCIHPTNDGYHKLGDYWYEAVASIPSDWISTPLGADPERPPEPSGSVTLRTGKGAGSRNSCYLVTLWLAHVFLAYIA